MQLGRWAIYAAVLLAALHPVQAIRGRQFTSGLSWHSHWSSQQLEERQHAQSQAAGTLQTLLGGLENWTKRAASLQELNFMTRFKDWILQADSSAEIEAALDKMTKSNLWNECGMEHGTCNCESGVARYGVKNSWVYKNITGEFTCQNSAFRADPSPGAVKFCQCRAQFQGSWNDGPTGPTHGKLLWSCGKMSNNITQEVESPTTPEDILRKATMPVCLNTPQAKLLDVYLDERFKKPYSKWVTDSGWIEEAYVTYMAGKKNSEFEWMATNLIRSVHLFSTRPIVVVNFDDAFDPPEIWNSFPNLLVYRMLPLKEVSPNDRKVSFNFNKIRAMIGSRVSAGIQVDLDQVIFGGMDTVFPATRRESNREYPYPILPVHWMSREATPGEPYYEYAFKDWAGYRSMRWNHAHPTWSFWSLPFLTQVLDDRVTVNLTPPWMKEDEDMLNVMLWKVNGTKAWCKFDLEPDLYVSQLARNAYYDPKWYPTGLPLVFYGAHNTKHIPETDWLLTLMTRCGEPSRRDRAKWACPASKECKWHTMTPTALGKALSVSEEAADEVCCCVRLREETPLFWQGNWYSDTSQVPDKDDMGVPRRCILP